MLVLSRKIGETIRVGDDIVITVTRIGPNSVRIGVAAPNAKRIVRGELVGDLPVNGSCQEGERTDCEGHDAPFYSVDAITMHMSPALPVVTKKGATASATT